MLGSIGDASAILDSAIFIPSQLANGLEVYVFDIENEEWGENLTFDLVDTNDEDMPYMKVMNGKLYAVYATNDGYNLLIGDLYTGESLYEGKLHLKNQGEGQKDYHLYIHEAELAQ
ncbi:hypothetical protein [Sporosarcina sp. FA9]|uniref:hypothetical protein n=1 Tax=Sporosarcina sp. FA9 TaxID=3413030 RepID=UPI003F656507